jgi:Xaa-Pro aminopeptidase
VNTRRVSQPRQITTKPPIVAVGPHSADPHYSPEAEHAVPVARGDFVLLDLWAKEPGGDTPTSPGPDR